MRRTLAISGLVLGCVGCDQGTKIMATRALRDGHAVHLLRGSVQLFYAENTGAFGSLGAHWPAAIKTLVFVVVPLVVLGGLLVHALRERTLDRWRLVASMLIVGGGLGNIIDRIIAGHVVDFMYVHVGSLGTNVFNVADVAVMVGVGLLVLRNGARGPSVEAGHSA